MFDVGGTWGNWAAKTPRENLTCGPGGYLVKASGLHDNGKGGSVNTITDLRCKSVYDDSYYDVSGRLGTFNTGKQAWIDCEGEGMTGIHMAAGGTLDTLYPICKTFGGNTISSRKSRMGKDQDTSFYTCRYPNKVPRNEIRDDLPHTFIKGLFGRQAAANGRIVQGGFICQDYADLLPYKKDGDLSKKIDCCGAADTSSSCREMLDAAAENKPSFDCPDIMRSYCTSADGKFLNDPKCKSWYANTTATREYTDKLLDYCGTGNNFNSDVCKLFCTYDTGNDTNPPGFKGRCNQIYSSKCGDPANHALDICSCHKPFETYKGYDTVVAINGPQELRCYEQTCKKSGYFPQPLAAYDCPSCLQNINIDIANASNTALANIQNTCNVGGGNAPGSQSPEKAAENVPIATPSKPASTTGFSTTHIAIGVGGLVVAILLVLIIVVVSSRGGRPGRPTPVPSYPAFPRRTFR